MMIPVSENLHIELLTKTNAEEVFALIDAHRKELRKWLPWVDSSKSVQDTLVFIQATNGKQWVIHYKNKIAGLIGLNKIYDNYKKIVIGYWLSPDFWGHGIMKQSCLAFCNNFFEQGSKEIIAYVSTVNPRSTKLIKSLGFVETGVIPDGEILLGNKYDQIIFTLSKVSHYPDL
tara:strand:+ start:408 stop:929 length:522 start_codon:yes stop_codon:yes gene_type:complete